MSSQRELACGQAQDRLWAFVHGDTQTQAGDIEAHLARCSACAASVARMRSLLAGIRAPSLSSAARSATDQPVPERIGNYRIIRRIGQGGMGVVYEAEQQEPSRRVALKVIRDTGLVDEYHARLFRREMHTLARLNHPAIASIYDAGVADDGRSYFAMELVDGVELSAFLAAAGGAGRAAPARASGADGPTAPAVLPLRQRLDLLLRIADAVSHAHQRGVIHRDLKPSNILVTPSGQPKVLDFGLARVIDTEMGAATLAQETSRFLGTLQYTSPEQARSSGEIDVRTDVYALGLLLFEMLTGGPPFRLDRRKLPEALKVICETPAPDPRTLNRAIPADLATIALKALEKEPARRYATATEFAEDLRRFLTDRPIAARRPSALYLFGKFARRNKAVVAATVAVVLSGVAALVLVSAALTRALTAERVAAQRASEAERARLAEREQRLVAQREADTAAAVAGFLDGMFASINPETGSRDITVRQVIDEAAADLEGAFPNQPIVAARLNLTLGRSYLALGAHDQAERHLQRGLELLERELGPAAHATLDAVNELATLRQAQGDYDAARPLFERALDGFHALYGDEHPRTLSLLNNLGMLMAMQGQWPKAEPLFRRALEGHRRASGDEHVETLDALSNLSTVLQYLGRYDEALPLARQSLETRRRALGPEHPGTLVAVNNLGTLLADLNRTAEAEPLYRESLELSRKVLGAEHPDTLISIGNMAGLLRDLGRLDDAERMYREALALRQRVLGERHPDTIENRITLGMLLLDRQRLDEADALLGPAEQDARDVLGEDHPDTIKALQALGMLRSATGQTAEAVALLGEAVERSARVHGPESWRLAYYQTLYGDALVQAGDYERAEPLLVAGVGRLAEAFGDDDPRTQGALRRLVRLYDAVGGAAQAGEVRARIRE